MFLYPYAHTVHFSEPATWAQSPESQESKVTFSTELFGSGNGRMGNNGKSNPLEGVVNEHHLTISPVTTFLPGENFQQYECATEHKPEFGHGHYPPISTFTELSVTEKCRTCGDEMVPGDIIQHMRNHMGPRRCEVCNYEAPTKHHLREHLNTHTGLKPYKCQFCDKSFAAKNSLRVHTMYLHTKVRAHQCHYCDQRFVTTSERKSHELVHTDKCPVCQMSFRLRGHLRQHMKSHANTAFHHKKR